MLDHDIEHRPDAADGGKALPKTDDAGPWLKAIELAAKTFETYQEKADRIDELYGDLQKLGNVDRDRDFQLFWANIQVLAPSIYARPPIPVVAPKFPDNDPVLQVAAEVLERCTAVSFDLSAINEVMLELRDDLAILSRAVAWVRYEDRNGRERVCIEHVDRADFLHEPARKWAEVGWVARRAWLTIDEMKERFAKTSGRAYENAEYATRCDDREKTSGEGMEKAGVWEIWSKTANRVVWVSPGVDVVLDSGAPHLDLEGFFPCPRPVFGTRRRRSLIPIPDMVYYKDQLEEIAGLTRRIHALSDAVKVKGFYPSAGEQGDAIETAMKVNDDRKVMVPISNWAAFGEGGQPVVWLPVETIVTTITALVALRRQVIDDVYQIIGLSDIMRGSTQANETATAQNIKAQYGSVRIRDRQQELVRVARDLARIVAEIIAENFDPKTITDMCRMKLPHDAASGQQAVSFDQVMKVLRDQRIRPFSLDIETDSTIQPDEQAEKEARNEFMGVFTRSIATLGPLINAAPEAAQLAGAMLKFVLAPYRAGRQVNAQIDAFTKSIEAKATQSQPDPQAQAEMARIQAQHQQAEDGLRIKQAELALREQELLLKARMQQQRQQAELFFKQKDAESRRMEAGLRMRQLDSRTRHDEYRHRQNMKKGDLEIDRLRHEAIAASFDTEG